MFSDADLDAAVAAGVLSHADARALRDFVAAGRASPAVDEEHFRLISGFNDIFVSIAILLVLVPIGGLFGGNYLSAAIAWGLAEYFTRRRRMALPSILLLLAFATGLFFGTTRLLGPSSGFWDFVWRPMPAAAWGASGVSIAAAVTAAGCFLHWRRFHVPITVAAGTAAALTLAVALLLSALPPLRDHVRALLLIAGLAVFALAMRWDMADRARETRRSDVAFWLHLLAAPLIVHPVFCLLGVFSGGGAARAWAVLLLYAAMAVVALAIDRRALMVSALAYVLYALTVLLEGDGRRSADGFLVTAVLIGSALLLLSAFWHSARRAIVTRLPADWQARLPQLDRAAPLAPPA